MVSFSSIWREGPWRGARARARKKVTVCNVMQQTVGLRAAYVRTYTIVLWGRPRRGQTDRQTDRETNRSVNHHANTDSTACATRKRQREHEGLMYLVFLNGLIFG